MTPIQMHAMNATSALRDRVPGASFGVITGGVGTVALEIIDSIHRYVLSKAEFTCELKHVFATFSEC